MNFFPYFLLWFIRRALGNTELNACINNTSGDHGICLSVLLCANISGVIIGTCSSSVGNNICCKKFVIDNEVNNASSVIPPNVFSSYEESKVNSTLSISKPVLMNVPYDPQITADMDSAGDQLNVFQRNHSSKHRTRFLTTKHPRNDDQNYSSDVFELSPKFYPKLYFRSPLLAKKYVLKPVKKYPIFSSQTSNEEAFKNNQMLHDSNTEHNLQKLVNETESDVSELSIKQENHDLRNSVQVHVANYLRKPVQTDSTFYLQKSVQIDSSHNLQKQVLNGSKPNYRKIIKGTTASDAELPVMLTVDHDFRNPVQDQSTNHLHKSVQTDTTFYFQKPVQIDPSHDLRKVDKVSDSPDIRRSPTQKPGHYLQDRSEPVTIFSTFHHRKPVQVDLLHDLRKVVKVSDSHDLRWPRIEESDHDLRNPDQVHTKKDLRKPVQTDSTFYLQKPVQVDLSHNCRPATVWFSTSHI